MIERTDTKLVERMKVARYAMRSPYSSLYRDLYGTLTLAENATEEDWARIPPIEKDRIMAAPFRERLFAPLADIDYVRASSGTSGKNILVVPKTRIHPEKQVALSGGMRHVATLTFFQPQHQMEIDHRSYGHPITVLSGDPSNLEACTRLAKDAGVNSLRTYPHLLERQLPYLERYGLTDTIEEILMTGERLSIGEARRYLAHFPRATLALYYALTESQGVIGVASVGPEDTAIRYEPMDDYYLELVDEAGAVIDACDTEGEILCTTLWAEGNVFPLVRYRTGDLGVRRREADSSIRYEIIGRKALDRIKIARGELRIEEVERALLALRGADGTDFELHYHRGGERLPSVVIMLRGEGADTEALARAIEAHLVIAPERVYRTLVDEGLHVPLSVEFTGAFEDRGSKRKRFQVHET
jgi:phenylacetate-coenzyme A ligase PaaK-like adenylate-forming protein